ADLALHGLNLVNDLADKILQVGDEEGRLDVAERPADVGGQQAHDLLGRRGEAADAQVAADHDDGDVHASHQVGQGVVDMGQLEVAVLQLFVDRSQLFVRRL